MDLLLWRHAEAEDGASDLARRLTAKGERQAAAMAEWLRPRLSGEVIVIASEAVRSQQTARALTDNVVIRPDINPNADFRALLAAVNWPEVDGTVVLTGHQPTLGFAASFLLAGTAQPWAVKKGAVWWLSNRSRNGCGQTVLKAMQTPDLLR